MAERQDERRRGAEVPGRTKLLRAVSERLAPRAGDVRVPRRSEVHRTVAEGNAGRRGVLFQIGDGDDQGNLEEGQPGASAGELTTMRLNIFL